MTRKQIRRAKGKLFDKSFATLPKPMPFTSRECLRVCLETKPGFRSAYRRLLRMEALLIEADFTQQDRFKTIQELATRRI